MMRTALLGFFCLLLPLPAQAQFNPFSIVTRAISTSMDARTKQEVVNDTEIYAGANERLLADKRAQWSGVGILVFAQHVVLAGAVKTPAAKKLVEQLVRADKRVRSLRNELRVIQKAGDEGSFVNDTTIETKIDARLTVKEGVSSVNMRWKSVAGRVVVMGLSQSKGETALALAEIRAVDGVKDVKSHLRLVPK